MTGKKAVYSMRGIAVELDKRKVPTPRGGAWHPQLVARVVRRLAQRQACAEMPVEP